MIILLSLSRLTNGFIVFHEEENQYVRAEVGSNGDMAVTAVYPKKEYGNYTTFWNILGKFDHTPSFSSTPWRPKTSVLKT